MISIIKGSFIVSPSSRLHKVFRSIGFQEMLTGVKERPLTSWVGPPAAAV